MKPKITYTMGTDLFNAMDTVRIMEDQDKLESQLRNTALAERMLKDIGVNVK